MRRARAIDIRQLYTRAPHNDENSPAHSVNRKGLA